MIGNDVLTCVVAFGRTGPEEEAMEKGWSIVALAIFAINWHGDILTDTRPILATIGFYAVLCRRLSASAS